MDTVNNHGYEFPITPYSEQGSCENTVKDFETVGVVEAYRTPEEMEKVKQILTNRDGDVGPTTSKGSNGLTSNEVDNASNDTYFKQQLKLKVISHVLPHFLENRLSFYQKDYKKFADEVSTVINQIVEKVMKG